MQKHTSSQKSPSLWRYVGFSSACFPSPRCSYVCSAAQAAAPSRNLAMLWHAEVFTEQLWAPVLSSTQVWWPACLPGHPCPLQKSFPAHQHICKFQIKNQRMHSGQRETVQVTINRHSALPKATYAAKTHNICYRRAESIYRGRQGSATDKVQASFNGTWWKQ